MARAHHDRRTPGDWLRGLFRQPPPGFYSRPAVYLSGDRMEIEHFEAILTYDETRLRLQLPRGQLTIYGERLQIETLTARIIICGMVKAIPATTTEMMTENRSAIPSTV